MQRYGVRVVRTDPQHVEAEVRQFRLTLGAHRGDQGAGVNPVETLLSAVGACLLSAVASVADASHVSIKRAEVELSAERQDRPPTLVGLTYTLYLETDVTEERLERLMVLAERNSTVFQTIAKAIPVQGSVSRYRPAG
jgi:putative redox protein